MRTILFLIWTLGIPFTLLAQKDQTSWANLNVLQLGHKIEVLDTSSKKYSGTLVRVSDSAITFNNKAGEQDIAKQNVRRVKLMENKHRLRNTLIGAGVGAGIAAVGNVAAWDPHGFLSASEADATAGSAIFGALIGAIVGVFVPSHLTIYNIGSH